MSTENSYKKITNTLNFAVSFQPTSAFPIDARSMFGSYAEAVAAAATAENAGSSNTVYYIGQMLTVFENGVVGHYSIQPDKTLKAIGAQVVGDDKTIVIGDDGLLSLKSFGVEYYAYNANTKAYTLTSGWKAGLSPKVIQNSENNGYELAWYEPSTITVEGLSDSIATLQTDISNVSTELSNAKSELNTAISDESSRAQEAEDALSGRITSTEQAITLLNGDSKTEGSVDNKIAIVIDTYLTGTGSEGLDTLKDLVDWANNHASDVLQMNNNITANATAIEALETLVGELPKGATATTVFGYIAEAVAAETARAQAKEDELANAIADVKKVTDAYDPSKFATSEQGARADTAVQSVVAGQTNGHIAVDGTDVKVYELTPGSVTSLGGVKASTSISINSDGVAEVAKVDVSKIDGLDTRLTSTKNEAVTESKEYTDNNFVAKTSITTVDSLPESVEAASDANVISEKVFMDAMTWRTTM